jgi:glycerol-3-phosphate acyltransferase PlsX
MIRIGINAGGDDPLKSLRGAYLAAENNRDIEVVLYLDLKHCHMIDENIRMFRRATDNLTFIESEDTGCLQPALVGLKKGRINALITATNNADLMKQTLKQRFWARKATWPGLLVGVPIGDKYKYITDGGATSWETDPKIFLGWGKLGRNYLARRRGIKKPRIRLVNISAERAFPELEKIDAHLQDNLPGYEGYGEPNDFFSRNEVDLWVCNGFVGNLLLKMIEEVANLAAKNIIAGLSNREAREEARKTMVNLSYGENLLSPFLLPNHQRIFRVHGNTHHELIAKSFELAINNYKVGEDRSTW